MARPDDEDEYPGPPPPRQTVLPGLDTSKVETMSQPVTIYRMRVGRDNLTLSMFRQMMPETLVDEERVELRGEPWFFVNHDPDRPQRPDHRQFLVRFGKLLRRCPFRVRHIEGHPPDRGRPCEDDWPSHLHKMRSRHERLSLHAFIDLAAQGRAALPEGFGRPNRSLAFPDRPPFAAFSVEADEDLAWRLEGAIDPGEDRTIPVARIRVPSAAEHQRECREQLRKYLADRGDAPGKSPGHWESLIEHNAGDAREYVARWNALMDDLLRVDQLFIG